MSNKVDATFHGALVRVRMRGTCPNYYGGQVGILGRVNEGSATVRWVEFGVEKYGSTGCWCGPGEYEVIAPQPVAQLEVER